MIKFMENGVMMQYFEWNLPNDGHCGTNLKKMHTIYMK